MHVGIITYDSGHLKTYQLLSKLRTKPFRITVFAFPFKVRPIERCIFDDRPFQLIDLDIEQFCQDYGFGFKKVSGWSDEESVQLGEPGKDDTPDVYLTTIAKIIPKSFIDDRVIINAHPGMLPENRGIDAFKWSIINGWPIGVSLHVIDEVIDRGTIIHRQRVPIFEKDKLQDVIDRAYEMEVDLQANFDYYLDRVVEDVTVSDKFPLSKKSVPKETVLDLENIFQKQKSKLISQSREEDDLFVS